MILVEDPEIFLYLVKISEENPKKNWVKAYYFNICLLNGTIIGQCDLRCGHNENIYYGGNIGYTVKKEFRGHGYARKACQLLFQLAKEKEMNHLFIPCSHNNIPSYKTCEKLGGEYLGIKELPESHPMFEKGERQVRIYKFDL